MAKPVIITCAPTGGIHTPGGNLRVGMEDRLYIGPGELTPSNAAQVSKIRTIIEALGFRVATATEARARLDLMGADRVNF
jgi:uncharacterized protein (DUF849 family)